MFGVDTTELLVVAVLALLFIGPKELPQAMLKVGRWVGKVRGYARHFTSGIENVMREAELDEMERKWRLENERIMALHPPDADYPDPPAADPKPASPGKGEHPRPGLAEGDDDQTPPDKRPLP